MMSSDRTFEDYSIIFPGRIEEYDPETQLAVVKISAERVYHDSEGIAQTTERSLLQDVPVHSPSGGGWSITMPIVKGDTCLIMFSQIGYDHWLHDDLDTAGKLNGHPQTWLGRKFNINDGFALVGFNPVPRAITDYSPDASQWRNVDASQNISLNSDGSIEITSATGVKVNGDLEITGQIINTQYEDHTHKFVDANGTLGTVPNETDPYL